MSQKRPRATLKVIDPTCLCETLSEADEPTFTGDRRTGSVEDLLRDTFPVECVIVRDGAEEASVFVWRPHAPARCRVRMSQ
jgi:hypothetical protein